MSRTSRVPNHQNVYDLLNIVSWETLPHAEALIAEWERQKGREFPAAMREFYSTAVTLQLGGQQQNFWTLSLPELWSEYSNADQALSVPEVFEHFVPLSYCTIPAAPAPGFQILWENQGCYVMCARDDGSQDPLVDVSGGCVLSTLAELTAMAGWHTVGRFSEVVFAWLAVYYSEDFTPISFNNANGPRADFVPERFPPKSYANGLWLRTPAEPFEPAAIKKLSDEFGEPERTPRSGIVTFAFRPTGGTIRITADEPGLVGAMSAWWLHADTPERLVQIARLVEPFGTLRESLRADTEPARDVLRLIQSGRRV